MAAAQQQLSHAYPLGSRVAPTGRLELGGCDAVELAREFGTPCYVVVEDDIRARAHAFVEAFRARTDRFEVHFAAKAFPCSAVLRLMAEAGLACDVASGGELHLALRAGFDPARIHLHGNAKSERELREALDAGVGDVVLDNAQDLDRLEALLPPGARQRVQMRIAPGISPDTHPGISTGGPNTKFGFSLHDAPAAIARVQASDRLDLDGLHLHIGSQIMDLEPFRDAVAAIAALGDFRTVNLGGGLGAVYTAEDRPPSIEDYVAAKVDAVRELLGPDVRVLDEPGRALVANACVTLYSVETVKRNVSTWVAVDGGMSDNLRPMLYGARYEAAIADRITAPGTVRCHLAGKHCESSDVIAYDAELADPRPGDVVVTPATGAYCFSMSNSYNGVPRPPVVFARDGQARVVVRRETYDDLEARDVG
ncbi:MAG TPA: diaminopimelate decarboxylase [Solirubrobacteraceae bacterium]|nr:diaminopimelate decarboxylase [Solirubrobacteraceae bacterium]